MEISTVLLSLRANVESRDGDFGDVFLDRAKPHGMSERTFRSCLSDLIKRVCMSQSTASLGGVFELSRNLRLHRQHRERQVRLPVGID